MTTSGFEAPRAYEGPAVEAWFHERVPKSRLVAFDAFCDPDTRVMENVRVVLGWGEGRKIKPTPEFLNWVQDVLGKARLEAHFEVPALLDALGRGLGRAGFHMVVKASADGQVIFENAKGKELRAALSLVADDAHRRGQCGEASLVAIPDEVAEDCKALLAVRSTAKKPLEVEVSFEGEVPEEEAMKLLGFVRDQLPKRVE